MEAKQVLELMKKRRSYRMYEDQQISEEQLEMILQAGLYAPNAGGRQSALFLVTQEQEINEALGKVNRSTAKIVSGRYVNKSQPSIIDNPDIKSAFYGAPTVITLLGPKKFLYSEADCAVSAQNMMLMAEALCLGSCMIARAGETMRSEYGLELLKEKGIGEEYQGFYHILIGYPKGNTVIKDRKDRVFK